MIFDNESFANNYKKFHDDGTFKYHDVFLEKYIEDGAYVSRGLDGTKNIVKYNDDKLVELLIEELYLEDDESDVTECISTTLYNYYDSDKKNFGYTVDIEVSYLDQSTGVEHFVGNDKSFYKNTFDGNLIVKSESNLGYYEEMEYTDGLIISKKDSKNPHQYYEYNEDNMLSSLISGNYETVYEYDNKQLVHMLKLKNNVVQQGIQYSYNDEGLLKSIVDLDDNFEEYEYDMNGRIVGIVLNDICMSMEYDEHGHLSNVFYDNGYVEEWDFRVDGVLISYGDNEGEVFINDVVHYNEMDASTTFPMNNTVH
jgi:YD repeat-containing protein